MKEQAVLSIRERKKKDCKYKIIWAVRESFRRNGVDAVSVNDIIELADISRATFFNYFPNREAMYAAICLEELEDMEEYVELALLEENSCVDKIKIIFKQWVDDAKDYGTLAFRVTEAYMMDKEHATTKELDILEMIVRLLKDGVYKGELKEELNCEDIAAIIIGLFYPAIIYQMKETDYLRMLEVVMAGALKTKSLET